MKTAVKDLKESFVLMKNNFIRLGFPIFSDMLFLLVYGYLLSGMSSKMIEYLSVVSYKISVNFSSLVSAYASEQSILTVINSNPELQAYFYKLVLLFLIAFFAIYLCYCLLQGFSWKLSLNMLNKGGDMWRYSSRFFLVNIPWFLLYMIYEVITFFNFFSETVAQRTNPSYAPSNLNVFMLVFLVLVAYFALISYVLIEKNSAFSAFKKSFAVGIKQFKKTIPAYIVILLVLLLIQLITIALYPLSYTAMLIAGFLLFFPAIVWARVYLRIVVE